MADVARPAKAAKSPSDRTLGLRFDPIERAFELWEKRWGRCTSMLAITSVMRAQQLLLAEVDAIVRPYGLTFARYEALVLLTFSRAGELPLSKMGERLMVHPTSVTNIVDRLEQAGLVVRKPNPRDGRGTLAEITAHGREIVELATQDLMAAEFGLAALDEDAHQQLFTTLRELRVAAGDFSAVESS
jgi:DNA-binding MarR family transcriptional regulator